MNATIESRLKIDREVVEANNVTFREIVQQVFDGLNQKYGQNFRVEFRHDRIGEMERHDVLAVADVFYAPKSGNPEKIGTINAPRASRGFCDLGFRFSGSAEELVRDESCVSRYLIRRKADKFLQDLDRTLTSTEMPNARYKLDPMFAKQ